MRRCVRNSVSLFMLCLLLLARTADAAVRVYIVLIDGLDARFVNAELTPTLWALGHGGKDHATFYPDARAVMPSVTNTNHAAIMTAAYAGAHGIVGNALSDRQPGHLPASSEFARFLEVETLFTVIENDRPALVTAGLFGKSRLVNLFADVPRQQRRPDVLWGDALTETEPFDARAGFGSDQRTMDEVLRTIAVHDPQFMFAALPDVDRTGHLCGPDAQETRKAVLEADRQLRRLIGTLKERGSWAETVLMITADHGMTSVEPNPGEGRAYPLLFFGRELARNGFADVALVSSGGVEFLLLPSAPPPALSPADAQRLAQLRALALAQPEVAEAWYRLPNPRDGGEALTLAHAHPDWHLDHARAGELVLVAQPHYQFSDPFFPRFTGLLGNHGGPGESHIPILITGGDPRVRAQIIAADAGVVSAANPDLGATAAWLLGVRMPRLTSGKPVPKALSGRVLREAFE
jgi:hypothetical protein